MLKKFAARMIKPMIIAVPAKNSSAAMSLIKPILS
jgi:hypothetical protein